MYNSSRHQSNKKFTYINNPSVPLKTNNSTS
jgi:hypothetical protein